MQGAHELPPPLEGGRKKESYYSDGSTPVSIQPARQLLGNKFNFLQKSLGPSGCPFGCSSDIDSSCGTFAGKRHHVVGDDDLLTIGLGEQRPRLVEA